MLAKRGLRVAILEQRRSPCGKPGEVLTPNAVPMLVRLGLLEALGDGSLARPLACLERLWGGNRPERLHFLAQPGGRAWAIDRPALETRLLGQAVAAGARLLPGHRVGALSRRKRRWSLDVREGDRATTIEAAYLVDATGRPAAIARRLGAQRRSVHRLAAIHAQLAPAPRQVAWPATLTIEATTAGWWYAVEGPAGALICALLTGDPGRVKPQAARCTIASAASEARLLPRWVDEVARDGMLRIVDASPTALDRACGDGWLAVGDAAASFDPIASQGLPNAFASAIAGAEAVRRQLDGDPAAAPSYARQVLGTWAGSTMALPAVYRAALLPLARRHPRLPGTRGATGVLSAMFSGDFTVSR